MPAGRLNQWKARPERGGQHPHKTIREQGSGDHFQFGLESGVWTTGTVAVQVLLGAVVFICKAGFKVAWLGKPGQNSDHRICDRRGPSPEVRCHEPGKGEHAIISSRIGHRVSLVKGGGKWIDRPPARLSIQSGQLRDLGILDAFE